jgi:hypothetical protein
VRDLPRAAHWQLLQPTRQAILRQSPIIGGQLLPVSATPKRLRYTLSTNRAKPSPRTLATEPTAFQ